MSQFQRKTDVATYLVRAFPDVFRYTPPFRVKRLTAESVVRLPGPFINIMLYKSNLSKSINYSQTVCSVKMIYSLGRQTAQIRQSERRLSR